MNETSRMLRLLKLQKVIASRDFDTLGLNNLGALRLEVEMKQKEIIVSGMRRQGKSDEEIVQWLKANRRDEE